MSSFESHSKESGKLLGISFVLNSIFTIFEFIVGLLSGSLALISDAGHNLTDSLSIIIAFLGNKASKKEADVEHSYGHGRMTILSALLNSSILIGLALYIFFEAYHRMKEMHPVGGMPIILTALVGILINGLTAYILSKNKKDLNIRSVFMNLTLDVVALVGTLVAGFLILLTGQPIIDPIVSIFIGLMLLYGAWGILKESVHVLLEGTPEGVDIEKIKDLIRNIPSVKAVDDLHIWAISSHYLALSCHIVIEDCNVEESTRTVKEIKKELKEKFQIEHVTIETELTECPPDKK